MINNPSVTSEITVFFFFSGYRKKCPIFELYDSPIFSIVVVIRARVGVCVWIGADVDYRKSCKGEGEISVRNRTSGGTKGEKKDEERGEAWWKEREG